MRWHPIAPTSTSEFSANNLPLAWVLPVAAERLHVVDLRTVGCSGGLCALVTPLKPVGWEWGF